MMQKEMSVPLGTIETFGSWPRRGFSSTSNHLSSGMGAGKARIAARLNGIQALGQERVTPPCSKVLRTGKVRLVLSRLQWLLRKKIVLHVIGHPFFQAEFRTLVSRRKKFLDVCLGEILILTAQYFGHFDELDAGRRFQS